MRFIAPLFLLFCLFLCTFLTSCGPSEDEVKKLAQNSYNIAVKDMKNAAVQGRNEMSAFMSGRLILYSFVLVFLTLCGPALMEWCRVNIGALFKMSIGDQVELFKFFYVSAAIITLGYSLFNFGFQYSTPVVVFLAGTIFPYLKFIEALENNDINERKTNFAKIKTLFFLCFVVIIIYSVLSEDGFMSIKLDTR
jgi:hypothetical protein